MTIREIKQRVKTTQALETISYAYSELAGQRLVAIRSEIESNRNFVVEISNLFHVVKSAAKAQGAKIDLKKTGSVNLLITSNSRFYGGLERRLLDFFLAHSVLSYGKTIVIGNTGAKYLESSSFSLPYETMTLKRDVPDFSELSRIVDMVLSFEKVNVYYAKMQSVLVQKPVVLEIGGISDIPADSDVRETYFIFEPELAEMLKFFDRKIVQVLITQAFFESELARTAARMVSMEQSKINAEKTIKTLERKLFVERGNLLTFKMLDVLAGTINKVYD